MMTIERGGGFVLVVLGVGIILYSLYASHTIFTGGANPPQLFSSPEQKPISFERKPSQILSTQEEFRKQIEGLIREQLGTLLPPDAISKILNLFAWSVFAGLLMVGGGQIAGIGIKLLK